MSNYDLEERTIEFAISVRRFVITLPINIANREDCRQLIKSSGSIGANYCEANDNLSIKDTIYRVKIAKKEARETIYWLEIIRRTNPSKFESSVQKLLDEANQLMKILAAISRRLHNNHTYSLPSYSTPCNEDC